MSSGPHGPIFVSFDQISLLTGDANLYQFCVVHWGAEDAWDKGNLQLDLLNIYFLFSILFLILCTYFRSNGWILNFNLG